MYIEARKNNLIEEILKADENTLSELELIINSKRTLARQKRSVELRMKQKKNKVNLTKFTNTLTDKEAKEMTKILAEIDEWK